MFHKGEIVYTNWTKIQANDRVNVCTEMGETNSLRTIPIRTKYFRK
jgi:hypothetical protein